MNNLTIPSVTPSTNYNTSYENAVWIPEIIANETLGPLNAFLNLGRTVAKDTDLTAQRVGATINVPKRAALTSHDKDEDGDITLNRPRGTSVPVSLDTHREVSFGEEDMIASIQQGDPVPGYIGDAVAVLAEDIETDLLSHVDEFDEVGAADATTDIDDVARVREQLVLNKVPRLLQKYAYVHPTVITDLLKENAFKDPKLAENQRALTTGTMGRVHDIDFFEGQLVSGSGSPNVYKNLVYTRNALVLASRPLRLPGSDLGVQSANVLSDAGVAVRVLRSYNANKLAVQITVDVLFGTAVLDDRLGIRWHTA